MTLTALVPAVAAALFLLFLVYVAVADEAPRKSAWMFPAALSLLFLIFSLQTIAAEGPLGFWPNHTRNLWGNQVWLDLLLAVGVGWVLVVPRARALGMHLLPWLVLIVCTGSIGVLAMIARLLYLQEKAGAYGVALRQSPGRA